MRFTPPIDWREPVSLVLPLLQSTYPEVPALRHAEVAQVALTYSNQPIDEGAAALGQALSCHEYALYAVETGSDNSVFLLLPATGGEPAEILSDLPYRGPHDVRDAMALVKARLMRQEGRAWGQKMRATRQAKLNFRLPESALGAWDMGPGTRFDWLDDRMGWLSRSLGAKATTDEVRENSRCIDVTRWHDQDDGIGHMLLDRCADAEATAAACFYRGAAAAAVVRHGGKEVWLARMGNRAIESVLSLPTVYPPPAAHWGEVPAHVGGLMTATLTAEYVVGQVLQLSEDCIWLDCVVRLSVARSRASGLSTAQARDLGEALDRSAAVLLCYRVTGELIGWQLAALGPGQWGRHRVWTPATQVAGNGVAYLVRDVIDDTGPQVEFSRLWRISESVPGQPLRLQPLASSNYVLNGTACVVPRIEGLTHSDAGYLVYGACIPRGAPAEGAFAIVAVSLEDARIWSRSLQAMQPKFGTCRYSQAIHPKPCVQDWVLLDIVGDNFALQDSAWLWHLPTDQHYGIPLAAISADRENADLHYHPGLDTLFAYSTSYDRDDCLEMLLPMGKIIETLQSARGARRAVLPWVEDAASLPRNV